MNTLPYLGGPVPEVHLAELQLLHLELTSSYCAQNSRREDSDAQESFRVYQE